MMSKLAKWRDYGIALLTARRNAKRFLDKRVPRNVLVVCYGNIYRSPFAAASLGTVFAEHDKIITRSAGFHRREGRSVESGFQKIALDDFGIDLSDHRSRLITNHDLDWADLVLIMDGHNYRLMHDHYHGYLDKCIWLGAVDCGTPVVIRDPYGAELDEQRRIASQLFLATRTLAMRISSTETEI